MHAPYPVSQLYRVFVRIAAHCGKMSPEIMSVDNSGVDQTDHMVERQKL